MNSALPKKPFPWIWLMVAGILLIIFAAGYRFVQSRTVPEGNLSGSGIGHEFSLVDENGNAVTSASYDGKWRLMYFGYTYCPDICPTDTATMAAALDILRQTNTQAAQRLQPLFVTVDPERDTPEALAEYTDHFDPDLIGLTGSRAQIDAALKTFRVYARKMPGDTQDSYLYDHQAMFYLMDPRGRPVQFLAGQGSTPEGLAATVEHFLG